VHQRKPEFNRLAGREGKGGIREVVGRERLQQFPRARSHHRQDTHCGGDIGEHAVRARLDVPLEPVEVLAFGLRAADDQERRLAETRHGEVGFNAAPVVEPLGVDHFPGRNGDVVGAHTVQHAGGIRAFEPKFGERRLVEKTDRGPHRAVFVRAVFEPVLSAIAVFVPGLHPGGGIPVRALPAERLAEARARLA